MRTKRGKIAIGSIIVMGAALITWTTAVEGQLDTIRAVWDEWIGGRTALVQTGHEHYERALTLSRQGLFLEALKRLETARAYFVRAGQDYWKGYTWFRTGQNLVRAGRIDAAAEALDKALDIAEAQGFRDLHGACLFGLGELDRSRSRYADAERSYTLAITYFDEHEESCWIYWCRVAIAEMAIARGRTEQAVESLNAATAMSADQRPFLRARLHAAQADAARIQGRMEDSRHHASAGRELSLGNHLHRSNFDAFTARCLAEARLFAEARTHAETARDGYDLVGCRLGVFWCSLQLALIELEARQFDDYERQMEMAHEHRNKDTPHQRAYINYVKARHALATGDLAHAERLAHTAIVEVEPVQSLHDEVTFHLLFGQILVAQGKLDDGVAQYRTALQAAQRTGWVFGTALSQFRLGVALTSTDPVAAITHLDQSELGFERLGYERWLEKARTACEMASAS